MKIQVTAIALALCVGAFAQSADLDAGRTQSLGCQACHGSAGIGTAPDIPNLAGQKAGYIEKQLTAFRAKDRKHDLMNAIAGQLSDADIANLAAFWSSLPSDGVDAHGTADPAAEFRKSRMIFPASFPKGFVMYGEEKDDAGKPTKRVYANRALVDAARAGKPLPSGSTIVEEVYANGAVASYAGMQTGAGWGKDLPDILRNDDWSYALFDGKKTVREFNYARCLACHKPAAATSFVFTLPAIAALKQ